MQRRYCFVSGLALGRLALERLCAKGLAPRLVISYASTLAHRSGYCDYSVLCKELDVPLHETRDINDASTQEVLRSYAVDLMVVAGWSQLVRPSVLEALPLGGIGLHPTPLPVGRGRAPIPWTILREMRASAVTLFQLEAEADAGDIIAQEWFPVSPDATATELYGTVTELQASLLAVHVPRVLAGTASRRPQVGKGSVWPKRRPEDGRIDWSESGVRIERLVRALADPYPGAFTYCGGTKLTITGCRVVSPVTRSGAPGLVCEVVDADGARALGVEAGDGTAILLDRVRVDDGPDEPVRADLLRVGSRLDVD